MDKVYKQAINRRLNPNLEDAYFTNSHGKENEDISSRFLSLYCQTLTKAITIHGNKPWDIADGNVN